MNISANPKGSPCTVNGCELPVIARGWCSKHYTRWKTHGDPLFETLVDSLCSHCRINQKKDTHSWCGDCFNEYYRIRNRGGALQRERRYGLTEEDIYYMWLFQGGRCLTCSDRLNTSEPKSFHVDHDNNCCSKEVSRNKGTCGKCVRGLLCGSCNQGLGNFKDDVQRLKGAIAYLTQMEA